jgi:hypothetical protein
MKCTRKWFYHTFLYNELYPRILVVKNPNDGHKRDRNILVKNSTTHVNERKSRNKQSMYLTPPNKPLVLSQGINQGFGQVYHDADFSSSPLMT